MPIHFRVDHERKEIDAFAEGPIGYAEIEKHLMQEYADHGISYRELIDARNAIPHLSSGDVRQIAGLLRGLNRCSQIGRTAVVVSTDYAAGVIALLGMLIGDVSEMKPFRTEAEARAWLNSENASAAGTGGQATP